MISTCQRTPELAELSLSAHVTLSSDQLLKICWWHENTGSLQEHVQKKEEESIYLQTHQSPIVNLPSAFKLSFTHLSKTHTIQAQEQWTALYCAQGALLRSTPFPRPFPGFEILQLQDQIFLPRCCRECVQALESHKLYWATFRCLEETLRSHISLWCYQNLYWLVWLWNQTSEGQRLRRPVIVSLLICSHIFNNLPYSVPDKCNQ